MKIFTVADVPDARAGRGSRAERRGGDQEGPAVTAEARLWLLGSVVVLGWFGLGVAAGWLVFGG